MSSGPRAVVFTGTPGLSYSGTAYLAKVAGLLLALLHPGGREAASLRPVKHGVHTNKSSALNASTNLLRVAESLLGCLREQEPDENQSSPS